ncbi:NAD(P)H-dependent oxidoreductase [Robertkochia flava]|uniref:NAD(P)H-dependent oxidoreductase n=1 Tax=Robertkochia flava TaxID=3447986 RepID=UPI001CCBFDCC|nr:NAD(P)H-dependent oxidoreductase [Robertkochia marina]
MKTVIITGSARKEGETYRIATTLANRGHWDLIDLRDYDISHYDYDHENRNDDFLPLMEKIVDQYQRIVFATPVYWYAMSGIMKVFFDRLSDLLTIDKPTGIGLKDKHMAVISCSNGNNLGEAFWLPFQQTATYLGMHLAATAHFVRGTDVHQTAERFFNQLNRKISPEEKALPFQPRFLDHVAIRVRDLDLSCNWYSNILGLKPYRFQEWGPFPVFMMAGTSGVALFPLKKKGKGDMDIPTPCVDHFAFHIPYEEFEGARRYFEHQNINVNEQDHFFFLSLYIKDPDGHTVELTTLKPGMDYFYDHPSECKK